MFTIPIDIEYYKSILFLGIGGGFDVYGSLPLWANITGKSTIFANVNLKNKKLREGVIGGDTSEDRLTTWLTENSYDNKVYVLPKVGVIQMMSNLKYIIEKNEIDFIICIDGGVDSIMQGNEEGAGTIIEDTVTMKAVHDLGIPTCLMCIGFGTETEEELCHHSALENIAHLTQQGGFLGSCSLTKGPEFTLYKKACEFGWNQTRKSHIHTKVISAVEGHFGESNLYDGIDAQVASGVKVINYINPLMPIMWFFDLKKVIANNYLAKPFGVTSTSTDVLIVYRQMIDQLAEIKRKRQVIPL